MFRHVEEFDDGAGFEIVEGQISRGGAVDEIDAVGTSQWSAGAKVATTAVGDNSWRVTLG